MTRILSLLLLLLAPGAARADEVTLLHDGVTLAGQFDGREAMRDGVVLIVHDLLGHGDDETVRPLRQGLAARGRAVLSITLSLGVDRRRGAFPCDWLHIHRYDDALPEIDAWVDWLTEQGTGPITLAGVGGGASQAALWSARRANPAVTELALVWPETFVPDAEVARWVRETGTSLRGPLRRAEEAVAAGRPGMPLDLPRFLSCGSSRATAATFLSYYGGGGDDRDTPTLLPRMGRPALVIVSEAAPRLRAAAGAAIEIEPLDDREAVAGVIDVYAETERLTGGPAAR